MTPRPTGSPDRLDDELVRAAVPRVIALLLRRGADFASAEDAVQEALVTAVRTWSTAPPDDPTGWLVTTAWRAFLDATRSDTARRAREDRVSAQPAPGPGELADDTLQLYALCANPALTPASAVALTLRAVGGLTTRQIADAYFVPEATMAQRISRAKRAIAGAELGGTADIDSVTHTLYLVFNEGYTGSVDLATEAIRLTRGLCEQVDDPEVHGLLALMLLHDARRPARLDGDGRLVPLAEQDRSRWDRGVIAEGITVLRSAMARDRPGPYQAQAAIAALHADARAFEETDWVQIVEWYDELLRFGENPVVRLNRAVALGYADGVGAGLAALRQVPDGVPRRAAVEAHLRERSGELERAVQLYVDAARTAPNALERDHQMRQAARINQLLRDDLNR